MVANYYDKQIIPLKVRSSEAEAMSLDTGYYIEGRLETFIKVQHFDDLLSIYIPESFIDMPDEIKEIKYPTNFRPEIIKTNLAGDVNLSISLLKVGEDVRHRDVNTNGIKENDNKEKIINKLWNDSATFYYSYDALDRLIKEVRLQGNKTYEYDKRGNLIGITDRGRE